jgi:hypothetical protein
MMQAALAGLAVAGPVERGVSPLCVSLNKTAHVREMKSVAICSDGVKNVAWTGRPYAAAKSSTMER